MKAAFAISRRSPISLFPIERMQPHFEGEKVRATRVIIETWQPTAIRLRLVEHPSNDELARLQLGLRDSLSGPSTNERDNFTGSSFYKHCASLWTRETVEDGVITFSRLRPFCQIENFYLAPDFRGEGIGNLWYHEVIEPFLKTSGIKAVATFGNCENKDDASDFWAKIGFDRTIINVGYGWGYEIHDFLHARLIPSSGQSFMNRLCRLLTITHR